MATQAPQVPRTAVVFRKDNRIKPAERAQIRISWVILLLVSILTLFPIVWVVLTSLNTGDSFAAGVLPEHYTLSHYSHVLTDTDFPRWIENTVLVGVVVGLIQVVVVMLLAYAFSRFHFFGRRYGLAVLLGMQLFPSVIALTAQYYMVNWVTTHWFPISDNYIGLIIIYVGASIPYMSWLFKGYIDTLPFDLEESAAIDGAGRATAFWLVIVPLCRPMMAVTFINAFIGVANEYLTISILVADPGRKTFSYGLFDFATGAFQTQWTNFAAAAVLGSIPFIAIFVLSQRWLVSGLSSGAVKG